MRCRSAAPLGAATLPTIAGADDAPRALAALAGVCAVGAAVAAVGMRDPVAAAEPADAAGADRHPLRDARIWRLAAASFALVVPQLALLGFVALYLHDERGMSPVAAGGVLAGIQVAGAVSRVGLGVLSDRLAVRLRLLRAVALAVAVAAALAVVLLAGPLPLTVGGLALAGVLALSWNGLAFLATAEAAAPGRRGAALGLQNTVVVLSAALTPVAFGITVAAGGWTVAFAALPLAPLLAVAVLAPLARTERRTVPA